MECKMNRGKDTHGRKKTGKKLRIRDLTISMVAWTHKRRYSSFLPIYPHDRPDTGGKKGENSQSGSPTKNLADILDTISREVSYAGSVTHSTSVIPNSSTPLATQGLR